MDFGTWFGPLLLAALIAGLVSLAGILALTIAVGVVAFIAFFWLSLTWT